MSAVTPVLRPVPAGEKRDGKTVHKMTMDVQELDREIAPGLDVKAWTFNGSYMGPVLHGKLGDVFEITLENERFDGAFARRSTRAWFRPITR